ncbi:MAG: hypothetical protein ACUVUP_02140 [Thermaceae bacterium]
MGTFSHLQKAQARHQELLSRPWEAQTPEEALTMRPGSSFS